MRQDSLQSVWHWHSLSCSATVSVSLYLTPPRCHLISLSLPPDYRPAAVHICTPLHLSLSRGWWRSKESVSEAWVLRLLRDKLTRFWREDVSQLLDDLLELQHRVLLMLHIISWDIHTHTKCYTLGVGREDTWFQIQLECICQPQIWASLHVADLLLQCQLSLCWPAPRGDPLQTQERTGLTVLIRWLLNHLWAVRQDWLWLNPNNCSYSSYYRLNSHVI